MFLFIALHSVVDIHLLRPHIRAFTIKHIFCFTISLQKYF